MTTVQADASDEAAIKGLCDRAIQEEGQLDVFFANVRGVELSIRRTFLRLLSGWLGFARPFADLVG